MFQFLGREEDLIGALLFACQSEIRWRGEESGVDNLGKRHGIGQPEVDIGQSDLSILYPCLLQRRVASESPAGDDIDLLIGKVLLRLDPIPKLGDHRRHDIIKEEDDLMLITEDALRLLPDDI